MKTYLTTFSDHDRMQQLAAHLALPIIPTVFQEFADGEIALQIDDSVCLQGATLVIVQSSIPPLNTTWIGIILLAGQLRKKGAARIILCAPYCGYMRSLEILNELITAATIDELVVVHPHNPGNLSRLVCSVHALSLIPLLAAHLKKTFGDISSWCFVAPDKGIREEVTQLAEQCGSSDMLFFHKERFDVNQIRLTAVEGTSSATTACVLDDILDTGSTALLVAQELRKKGFTRIIGYFIHPLFSNNAWDRMHQSPYDIIFVTNSLPIPASSRIVSSFNTGMVIEEWFIHEYERNKRKI